MVLTGSRQRPPQAVSASRPPRLPRPASTRRPAGFALGVVAAAAIVVVGVADPAWAQPIDPTLGQVIDRLRLVLVGLLAGLATLFLTVGGVRYLFAGADPGQVEKAKGALRAAAVGYGLAVLAPVLVRLLQYVVGA
jgi:Type IV secretion system pilin